MQRIIFLSIALLAAVTSFADAQDDAVRPDATMLRYPDVSATHIAFVYANDIWLVPREGGTASPLASPSGTESFPRFSPDGRTLAFSGNYDGNRDVYTLPVEGGVPHRVTYHPSGEWPSEWTSNDELLINTGAFVDMGRLMTLATVSANGGMPTRLPVPYGLFGAISPDGKWLAYILDTRDFSTWKRYRGGLASDIWLFNLEDHSARRITDWEGTDSQPMWSGRDVYYLSDAGPAHKLNIWKWDSETDSHQQVTKFNEYDVKWPSIGPGAQGDGEIVFQNGAGLYLLDLKTGQSKQVEVIVPGARPKLRPMLVDESKNLSGSAISATGKRAAFAARGDIWTIPARHGAPRALTRTSGVHERDPAWSPDGQWIAYFSDQSGEYRLYVMQSDGRGETKELTGNLAAYPSDITWSPDNKRMVFGNSAGEVYLHTIETGETRLVDTDPFANRHVVSFSPDSRWLAYLKRADNELGTIWLHDIESGQNHQVTSGVFSDSWPTFDREGKYLFFASNRQISSPIYADLDDTFVYANTDVLLMVPLRAEVGSPFAPENDEEAWGDKDDSKDEAAQESDADEGEEAENKATTQESDDDSSDDSGDAAEDGEEESDDKEKDEIEPVEIELDGFESRAIALPVDRGAFYNLAVNHKNQLIYTRGTSRGVQGKPAIKIFDPSAKDDKLKEDTVLDDAGGYAMSPDGEKLLIHKNGTWAIVDAAADQEAG